MKTLLTITVLMMSFASASVFAEGSKITKSTLTNTAENKNAMALTIGKGSKANVGSINVSGSEIKKSTLTNTSKNENAMALTIGKNSTANVGSINID